jgi:transposase
MRPLSQDLRHRVIQAAQGGLSTREVAERFGVCRSSVQRWLRRLRTTGDAKPLPIGGGTHMRRLGEEHTAAVAKILEECNDLTLAEIGTRLAERTGLVVSISTVFRSVRSLGVTRKKRSSTRRSASVPT